MITCTSHLRKGDVIAWCGRPHRVTMVNESRAVIVPVQKKIREYVPQTGKEAGKTVRFAESADPISISPNAELEIIGRWTGGGVVYVL